MTGGDPATITVSKLTSVKELRMMVKDKFEVEPECQNLFFQGKKMEDDYSMYDYSVRVNDMIQLMVRNWTSYDRCANCTLHTAHCTLHTV